MRETLERELKLEPEDGFAMPELPGEALEPRLFTSTYYDTPPRSLARCGLTLRRRVENGLSLWQLKLPRDVARAELEAAGGPAGPPQEIEALLFAHLRHGELAPVATLRTRRVGVRVVSGERSLADVVLDSVDVLDDGRSSGAFAEIEIELLGGDEDDLTRLSRVLRRAGAHRSAGTPKLMRVLELNGEPEPSKDANAVDHLRYLLSLQLRELEAFDPGVRLGADPEDLHRFRVATRRSRALIRASRPVAGDQLAELGEELAWLGAALGPVRDLDVLLEHLRGLLRGLGEDSDGAEAIIASLEEERALAHDVLLAAIGGQRYLGLLDRFSADLGSVTGSEPANRLVEIAAGQARRLRKSHAGLGPEPADARLHAFRIKAKRARYAAELAAQTGGKPLARLVRAVKELQDVAGLHQDAVVAEARVRRLAGDRTSLAAGRIIELERARRQQARAELPAVWKRVNRAIEKAF